MTPKEVYEHYQNRPADNWDMWDYSPYLKEIALGNILEIGAGYGVSTSAFLLGVEDNGGHVFTVDFNSECDGAKLYAGHPQWTFITANSVTQVDTILQAIPESLDVLLIDGGHNYETVVSDLANYTPRVKSDGLILLHDVYPDAETIEWVRGHDVHGPWEVFQAFDEFLKANPTWVSEIKHGRCGLGVIVKGT